MIRFLGRNWFIIALIALFLFALPGIVLCILTLAGADTDLNATLKEDFDLSYHLALPPGLALVLLLVPLLIMLLYFLKLKRKPLQVPSTFLWKKSIEDLHVNSLFQWLRDNILLVLQVLAVLVMIYAVLGIRFHGSTGSSKHYILLIDNSASMAATDVKPSRLEWAKEQALHEIDAAGDSDHGMVIVFNSKASTLQTYTSNRAKLREAVRKIEQTNQPTRIEEALSLAESLANPVRSTEDSAVQPDNLPSDKERTMVPVKGISSLVHLYSDGRFAKLTDASLGALAAKQTGNTKLLGNLNLKYHRAGQPGADVVNNVGIVGLGAVREPDANPKAASLDVHRLQVLVRVRNFQTKEAEVKLHLDVYEDDKLVHVTHMNLDMYERVVAKTDPEAEEEPRDDPGGPKDLEALAKMHAEKKVVTVKNRPQKEALFKELPPLDLRKNIVLHAYLANHKDDLAVDDKAWLAVGTLRKAKVLIVGPENAALEAFFAQPATERLAKVERLDAKEIGGDKYRTVMASGEVDLVIFNRCAPEEETDMPQANTFFIDRPPPPWKRGSKTLKNPFVGVGKQRDHPILRNLTTLFDISVSEAFAFDVFDNLDPKVQPLYKLPDTDPNRRVTPAVTKLLEGGEGAPLLFVLSRGAYTDLVLAFDLINPDGDLMSNWPLQPSFPLFLRNILYNLGNVDDAVRTVTVKAGETVVLRPEAGVKSLMVTPPTGPRVSIERGNRPDFAFTATEQIGVYLVERDDGVKRRFAVNLLDESESNIDPRDEIRIGAERYGAGQDRPQPRDLWKWILVVAVLLLTVEWYLYNRRVAV